MISKSRWDNIQDNIIRELKNSLSNISYPVTSVNGSTGAVTISTSSISNLNQVPAPTGSYAMGGQDLTGLGITTPTTTDSKTLGSSSLKWSTIYGNYLDMVGTGSSLARYSNTATASAFNDMVRYRGTEGSPSPLLSGDRLGFIRFRAYGYDSSQGVAYGVAEMAQIWSVPTQNVDVLNGGGSRLLFATRANNSGLTQDNVNPLTATMILEQDGSLTLGSTSGSLTGGTFYAKGGSFGTNGITSIGAINFNTQNITSVGNIIPATDATYDLGSVSKYLYRIYGNYGYFNVASSASATASPLIVLKRSRNTTASPAETNSGDTLGRIYFQGFDNTNTFDYLDGVLISAKATQAGSGSGASLGFAVSANNSGGSVGTNDMLLDQDGSLTLGSVNGTGVGQLNAGKGGFGTTSVVTTAQVQIDSTTKGFLPPRMTTAQKNAISSPAEGLMIYDTDLKKVCVYTTAWETMTSA